MQVTRPKSSKGRCRPAVSHAHGVARVSYHDMPAAPRPSSMVHERANQSVHSLANLQSLLRQPSVESVDEINQVLQHTLTLPTLTLNKYRVLPSIEKRQNPGVRPFTGLEEETTRLSQSEQLVMQPRHRLQQQDISSSCSHLELQETREVGCDVFTESSALTALHLETPSGNQGSLLLAIRSPSGRRFQQQFRASDTLQTVLAAAETRYGTKYEHGIIETMGVPRVSFSDLTQTLAASGIQNRSILCISQEYSKNIA